MAKHSPVEVGLTFVLHPLNPEMVNWGHWAVSGNGGRGHCHSLEGRYRPPPCWNPPDPPVIIDHARAVLIERALVKTPEKHRQALVLWYAYRLSAHGIGRKCGVRIGEIDPFMRTALNMVENLLTHKVKGRISEGTI